MKATDQPTEEQATEEPALIPVSEAAQRKGCTRQTIYNALERGDLTGRTFNTMRLVVVNEAFKAWRVKDVGRRAS